MPHERTPMLRRLLIGGIMVTGAVWIGVNSLKPVPPQPIIGMVRITEIKVEPEVSGRISKLAVAAGDQVAAGAVVAELSNPELAAAVAEARAALLAAKAKRDRVYAGVRQEEVSIAAREVDKAKSELTLAGQHLRRISDLARNGNASQQDLDNARAAVSTATAGLKIMELRHAEAERGPTAEERSFADAGVGIATSSLGVLERRFEKLQLKSPVSGVVEVVVGELGEATVPGRTVLTIADTDKSWFNFNVREDQLRGIDIGKQIALVAGVTGKQLQARISEMRRLDDFATWRAARAVGDHDLNTFVIRADPIGSSEKLPPGVTVWIAGQ